MKRIALFSTLITIFLLAFTVNLWAVTLYDDFSTDYIKKTVWKDHPANGKFRHEFVREIDTVNQVLVVKLGTNERSTPKRNSMGFVGSSDISQIKADIKVVAMNIDDSAQPDTATVFARISGYFYNKDTDSATGPAGDIAAEVCIGDQGNGLEAWYTIEEATGTQWGEVITHAHESLAQNLDLNTFYTLTLVYDGSNGFTFQISDGATSIGNGAFIAPDRMGASAEPKKGLGLSVQDFHGEWVDGYIHAEFDNVYVNGEPAAYETFDGNLINPAKWAHREYAREAYQGHARLHTRASDGNSHSRLLLRDAYTHYLQATARIESGSEVYEGAVGLARIGGYFYNQSRDPDSYQGYDGEVWVQVALELNDAGDRRAFASIAVANADKSVWTSLYGAVFATAIAIDTDYTLAINFTGTAFEFRCNNETLVSEPIGTPIYPSSDVKRVVESVLMLQDGESGYLKGRFDNVHVADPVRTTGTGTWISTTTNSQITGGTCDPPPDESGTAEVTQTGTEIVALDSLGHATGGVISGSRLLGQGSFLNDSELTGFQIDADFSDADHAAGRLDFESTFGCQGHRQFTLTRAYELNARFQGLGTVTSDPGATNGHYAVGIVVNLTAEPAPGYVFDRWVGNVTDTTQANTTVTMNADEIVTAYFIQPAARYDLTVTAVGQGTWTLDPPSGPYDAGSTVSLTANAVEGWVFVHWIGDVADTSAATTSIIMAENETVKVVFVDMARDADNDAVPDYREYGPNGNDPTYDGNGDLSADSGQAHVASCPTAAGSSYVTLAVADTHGLSDVSMEINPSPDDAPADQAFDWGFFRFTITGIAPGGAADIQIYLPDGDSAESYYKYGPTALDANAHWYGFEYHANTGLGAEYNANVITLHLRDGADGDDDLIENGQITDIGAPATISTTPASGPTSSGGGGGGCFIQSMR